MTSLSNNAIFLEILAREIDTTLSIFCSWNLPLWVLGKSGYAPPPPPSRKKKKKKEEKKGF